MKNFSKLVASLLLMVTLVIPMSPSVKANASYSVTVLDTSVRIERSGGLGYWTNIPEAAYETYKDLVIPPGYTYTRTQSTEVGQPYTTNYPGASERKVITTYHYNIVKR